MMSTRISSITDQYAD